MFESKVKLFNSTFFEANFIKDQIKIYLKIKINLF